MHYVNYIISAAVVLTPAVAKAQSVSGEVGIQSNYLDDDGFVYTDEPVVQGGLYLEVLEDFTIEAWGSHSLNTKEGGELDIGVSYNKSIGEEVELNLSAQRYFLRGEKDITALSGGITYGPVDVTVSYYAWDKNPDATRITAGYSFEPIGKLTVRPSLIYQTGFGEKDVFGAGVNASYALNDKFSFKAAMTTPFKGDRSTRASLGILFEF